MKPIITGFFVGSLLPLMIPASVSRQLLVSVSLVLAASIVVGVVFAWKHFSRPGAVLIAAAGFVGCLSVIHSIHSHWKHSLHESLIGTDVQLTVQVRGVPENYVTHTRFLATVLSCDSCTGRFLPKYLMLDWYGSSHPELKALDVWQLTVRLKPLRGLRNPHTFDRVAWAIQRGIHARGYVKQRVVQARLSTYDRLNLHGIRSHLAKQLASLPDADQHMPLVQALTVGIKTSVDKTTLDTLRETGTAHLLAISGLHISLFAVFGFWVGRLIIYVCNSFLGRWSTSCSAIDSYRPAIISSLFFASIYAALAGFALPTQRALIMVVVWAIARYQQRPIAMESALAIALLIVLMFEPLSLLGVGFWLSFGTVAIIVYLHRGRVRDSSPSIVARFAQLGRTHLLLGLFLLPATMWFFQAAVLVSPLANLVAIPVVSLIIVPLAMISVLAALSLPALANPILMLCQWCLAHLLVFLEWCEALALSAPSLTLPDLEHVVLAFIGLALLTTPRGLGIRFLGLPLIAPAMIFSISGPRISGVELHVLDVGQGLAALILTEQSTTLFDTGGGFPAAPMFERIVLPYLRGIGRHRIDTLIVSHGDNDHAAGLESVLRRFPEVTLIHSPALVPALASNGKRCQAGDTWVQDHVWFSFVHPGDKDIGKENDQSCVLLIFYGQSRLLLTGDIEQLAEQRLLRRFAPDNHKFPVSVMLAPHHGSRSSSSQTLLEIFDPDNVVFPAGNRNRHGFPHAEVQLRYKLVGATSYVTGRDGAIVFRFDEAGLREPPQTWWNAYRRFWHGKD